MKKKLLFILSSTTIISALVINVNSTSAYSSSPPASHSGSPTDNGGATCTACHSGGAATPTTGVITHNIPASGFVGGAVYNFSVTMSGAAAYGFQLTPQSPTSNVGLGSWIAGAGTSISTKYIRHSNAGSGPSKTWAFQWTAPATATAVTFYGAFNYADDNGGKTGDIIKTSSVTVLANTTDLNESIASGQLMSIFPNPTTDILHITSSTSFDKGFVYTLDGKLVKTISHQELVSKTVPVSELEGGIYFINLSDNGKNSVMKFQKN